MKGLKAIFLLGVVVALLGAAVPASASVWYRVTFTGEDLLNQQFVNGAPGSTAADNDLYDGARLLRVGTDGNHADAGRTYVESQQSNFTARWDQYTSAGYVLDEFNLWGLDGRGAAWGEDYKPLQWLSATGPTGWSVGYHAWQWGDPPAGYHTLDFPYWFASDPNAAIKLDGSNAAELVFTVDFLIDPTDAWWGQDTKGTGSMDAPKDFETGFVMWFGGYVTLYDGDGNMTDWHGYDGNMLRTANVVPEPASIAIWSVIGLSFVGVGVWRRRRAKVA